MGMVFYLTRLRCLARDRDGSAALEFAYAFPIIVMVVVGLLELMMIMFVSALMEGGLRDASRFAITGAMPAGMSREQAIVNIVNDRTLGLLDLTTDDVSLRVYEAFAQVGMPEPLTFDANGNGSFDPGDTYTDVNGNGQWDADMAAAGAGGSGDVVVYNLAVDWPLLTPMLAPFIGQNGLIRLGASIAVRNEPYDTAPP
jgi:Flp pilus assembly protein TadG